MRLSGKKVFQRIAREGRRVSCGPLSARIISADSPRLATAVPRAYGSAVERNRFRRRVRAAFRQKMADLNDMAAVVTPRSGSHAISFGQIEAFMGELAKHGR